MDLRLAPGLLGCFRLGYRFADAQMLEEAQAAANESSDEFSSGAAPEAVPGAENTHVIGHA